MKSSKPKSGLEGSGATSSTRDTGATQSGGTAKAKHSLLRACFGKPADASEVFVRSSQVAAQRVQGALPGVFVDDGNYKLPLPQCNGQPSNLIDFPLSDGSRPLASVAGHEPGSLAVLAMGPGSSGAKLLVHTLEGGWGEAALPGVKVVNLREVDGQVFACAADGNGTVSFWRGEPGQGKVGDADRKGDLETWTRIDDSKSQAPLRQALTQAFAAPSVPVSEKSGPFYTLDNLQLCLDKKGRLHAHAPESKQLRLLPGPTEGMSFRRIAIAPDRSSLMAIGNDGKAYRVETQSAWRLASGGADAPSLPPKVGVAEIALPQGMKGGVAGLVAYLDAQRGGEPVEMLELLDGGGQLFRRGPEGVWSAAGEPPLPLPPKGRVIDFAVDWISKRDNNKGQAHRMALVEGEPGEAPALYRLVSGESWVKVATTQPLDNAKARKGDLLGAAVVPARLHVDPSTWEPRITAQDGKVYNLGPRGQCVEVLKPDLRPVERFVKEHAAKTTGRLQVGPLEVLSAGAIGGKMKNKFKVLGSALRQGVREHHGQWSKQRIGATWGILKSEIEGVARFGEQMTATNEQLNLLGKSAKGWGNGEALLDDPQAGALAAVLSRMTIDVAKMGAAVKTPHAKRGQALPTIIPGKDGDAARKLHNQLLALREYLPSEPIKEGEPSMQDVATQLCKALLDIHARGGLPVPQARVVEGGKPALQRADIQVAAMAENLNMLAQLCKKGAKVEQLREKYAGSAVQQARDSGAPNLLSLWNLTKGDVYLRQCLLDPKHPLHKTMMQLADAGATPGETDKERLVRCLTAMSLSLQQREAMGASASMSTIFGSPTGVVDLATLVPTLGVFPGAKLQNSQSFWAAVEDFSGPRGRRALGPVVFALEEKIQALQATVGWSPVPVLTRLGIGIGGTNVRVSGLAAQSLILEESMANYWRAFLDGAGPVKLFNQSGVSSREFGEISGSSNSIGVQVSGAARMPVVTPGKDGSGGLGYLREFAARTGASYGTAYSQWNNQSMTEGYGAKERYPYEGVNWGAGFTAGQLSLTALTPAAGPAGFQAGAGIDPAVIGWGVSSTMGRREKTVNQYCPAKTVEPEQLRQALQALRAQIEACGEGKEGWLAELSGLLDEQGRPAEGWAAKADALCRRLEETPPSWQDGNTAVELESGRRQLLTLSLRQQQFDAGVPYHIVGPRLELALQAPWQVQQELIKELKPFLQKVEPDRVSQATVDMTLTEEAERRMHAMLCAGAREGISKDLVLAHIDRDILCDTKSYQIPAWRVSHMLTGVAGHDSALPTPLVQKTQGSRFTARILSGPAEMQGRRLVSRPSIGNQQQFVQTDTTAPWIDTPMAPKGSPNDPPNVRRAPSGPRPDERSAPIPEPVADIAPKVNVRVPKDHETPELEQQRTASKLAPPEQQQIPPKARPIPPALMSPRSGFAAPPNGAAPGNGDPNPFGAVFSDYSFSAPSGQEDQARSPSATQVKVPEPTSARPVNPFATEGEPQELRDSLQGNGAQELTQQTWREWLYGTATNAAWNGAAIALDAAGNAAGRLLTGLSGLYASAWGGMEPEGPANPEPEAKTGGQADPFKDPFQQAKRRDFSFRDWA